MIPPTTFRVFLTILIGSLVMLGCSGGDQARTATPAWPEVTREARPWTRWWWHGNAVTDAGLTAALEAYRAVGLGGVEITPIYGVAGEEANFIPYLSESWVDRLEHVLREGERLDLGVDMATGTGWPFGGPWVTGEHAPKYITHVTYRLSENQRLTEPVTYQQQPILRAVGNQIYETLGIYALPGQPAQGTRQQPLERQGAPRPAIEDLVEPVSANADLQTLALDQVRFPKPLPLHALIAFSGDGTMLDLTSRVDPEGKLDWVAPPGDWTLYALFQGWHGKMVERAAPGGEGNVIDHFSADALAAYLERFDAQFAGRDLGSLRGFFNDSYEVDDATGDADWTPAFFEEFQQRRGYDLRSHLPALLGDETGDTGVRVLSDYRQTISELILERFTDPWRDWAAGKDAIVRNQAHGSPANILDLYAASDIPETEGTEILRFKFASSAANATGKRLASAESATWLGEHFTSSLADVKAALDRYWLGGVNHVVYHGTAYSPPEDPWPGRLFYAAVHFTPANPMWSHFGALNEYVARTQSFLQAGRPDNDVLLYYPIFDRFADRGPALLAHFDGSLGGYDPAFRDNAVTLLDRGYAFDFISDRQLQDVSFEQDALRTGEGRYQVIVVPAARFVPVETVEALVELARSGATVVVSGGLPESVPGLGDLEARRARFEELIGQLSFGEPDAGGVREATIGDGRFFLGPDLEAMLSRAGVRREAAVDQGLSFVRRVDAEGITYLLVNTDSSTVEGWVPLAADGQAAAIYDPMTGASGYGAMRGDGASVEVYLQVLPRESRIVRILSSRAQGAVWPYLRLAGEAQPITGEWEIDFTAGGPEDPGTLRSSTLGSWTDLPGEAVKSYSGTAVYRISFARPDPGAAESPTAWLFDLGTVHESARVRVNGEDIGTLIGPNFQLPIDAAMLRDQNTIEIEVANLMANRIAEMDRQGVFWKKFYNVNFPARLPENRGENGLFDASRWTPLPSGLIGPVTLTPLASHQP